MEYGGGLGSECHRVPGLNLRLAQPYVHSLIVAVFTSLLLGILGLLNGISFC